MLPDRAAARAPLLLLPAVGDNEAMKAKRKRRSVETQFVADGESRLRQTPEFKARLRELRKSICARYAAELSGAGLVRRLIVRMRIAIEFRSERRKIEPSPSSLYSRRI
jgi:hypothetical protein